MRVRYWPWKRPRIARIEFRDDRPPRVLRKVKTLVHKGCFVTLRTADELYHYHQSEVRLVHVSARPIRPAVKKEASF